MSTFNKAMAVQLVSFDPADSVVLGSEVPTIIDYNYLQFRESVTLSKKAVDSLTDILYNYGYRGVFNTVTKSFCYTPRNAIVIVGPHFQPIGFIELCFECEGYRVSSKAIKAGDFCRQKYQLLKAFFDRQGIVFGVKEDH
jgi:hypothetical protein